MVKKEEEDSAANGHEQILLTKPGQRYPTPTPGVAERIFYETLYQQRPDSAMAQEWCVAYGILEDAEAAKVLKVIQQRKASGKAAPMFSSPSPAKANGAGAGNGGKKKAGAKAGGGAKKKIRLDEDVPVDTGLAEAGDEGVGTLGFS